MPFFTLHNVVHLPQNSLVRFVNTVHICVPQVVLSEHRWFELFLNRLVSENVVRDQFAETVSVSWEDPYFILD